MIGTTVLRERGGICKTRRVDLVVRVGCEDDLRRGRTILLDVMRSDARVLEEPLPSVTVREQADTGVDLNARPWVNNADYSETRWDLSAKIKVAFDLKGITIPYPQVDVHMDQDVDSTS